MAMDIGQLLAFIKQAPAQTPQLNIPTAPGMDQMMAEMAQRRQAKKMAGMADEIYGTAGDPNTLAPTGQMMMGQGMMQNLQNTGDPGTPSTGLFDSGKPMEQRLMELNKRMLASGEPGFQDQWSGNQRAMQGQLMGRLKAMELAKYDTANPTAGPYEKNLNAMGMKRGDPGFNEGMKEQMKKSKMVIDPQDVPFTTSELKQYERPDGSKPTGGTPRTRKSEGWVFSQEVSPEDAGKIAMIDTANKYIPNIDSILLDADGNVRPQSADALARYNTIARIPIVGDWAATNFSEADTQKMAHAFELGIQAITRVETGAAMAASELQNTRARFMPVYGEAPEVTLQKLNAYKYFIKTSRKRISSKNKGYLEGMPAAAAANMLIDQAFAKTKKERKKDEFDDMAPDEVTRKYNEMIAGQKGK